MALLPTHFSTLGVLAPSNWPFKVTGSFPFKNLFPELLPRALCWLVLEHLNGVQGSSDGGVRRKRASKVSCSTARSQNQLSNFRWEKHTVPLLRLSCANGIQCGSLLLWSLAGAILDDRSVGDRNIKKEHKILVCVWCAMLWVMFVDGRGIKNCIRSCERFILSTGYREKTGRIVRSYRLRSWYTTVNSEAM